MLRSKMSHILLSLLFPALNDSVRTGSTKWTLHYWHFFYMKRVENSNTCLPSLSKIFWLCWTCWNIQILKSIQMFCLDTHKKTPISWSISILCGEKKKKNPFHWRTCHFLSLNWGRKTSKQWFCSCFFFLHIFASIASSVYHIKNIC